MTTEALNGLALAWSGILWRASWQGAVAMALVWAVCRTAPRIPAGVRSWLWRLAVLKLVFSLVWVTPLRLPVMPARPATPPAPVAQVHAAQPQPPVPSPFPAAREMSAVPKGTPLAPTTWLLVLWLIGIGWGAARLFAQWRPTSTLTRSATPIAAGELPGHLQELCRRLGLRRVPALTSSPDVHGPLLAGVIRPTVVLPSWLVGERLASEVRMVLAHEAAHLKHRDLLWNWVFALAQVLFFFHPAIWLARREWHLAHEMACDELAVLALGTPASEYGSVLLAVAGRPSGEGRPAFATVGVAESYQALRARIMALGRIRPLAGPRLVAAGVLVTTAGIVGLVPWRLIAREIPPGPSATAAAAPQQDAPMPGTLAGDQPPHPVTQGPYRFRLVRVGREPVENLVGLPRAGWPRDAQLLGVTVAVEGMGSAVPRSAEPGPTHEAVGDDGRVLQYWGHSGIISASGGPAMFTWFFMSPRPQVKSLERFSAEVLLPPGWEKRASSVPVARIDPPAVFAKQIVVASLGWERRQDRLAYTKGSMPRVAVFRAGRRPSAGESYLNARYHIWDISPGESSWRFVSLHLVNAAGRAVAMANYTVLPWSGRSGVGDAGWGAASLTPERQQRTGVDHGAYVVAVNPNSPALRADVRPHDVILTLDGEKIGSHEELRQAVIERPGKRISVMILRAGRRLTKAVSLDTRPLWRGIDPDALSAGRRQLASLLPSTEGSFAEWRFQSREPVPETFTPVRAVARFSRPAGPAGPVRFEFRDVPLVFDPPELLSLPELGLPGMPSAMGL